MQKTTLKWGIGGALFFPIVFLLAAFNMPSFTPLFHLIVFPPLAAMDVIFPDYKEAHEIFIIVFGVLYLAALGFGIGALLSRVGRSSN